MLLLRLAAIKRRAGDLPVANPTAFGEDSAISPASRHASPTSGANRLPDAGGRRAGWAKAADGGRNIGASERPGTHDGECRSGPLGRHASERPRRRARCGSTAAVFWPRVRAGLREPEPKLLEVTPLRLARCSAALLSTRQPGAGRSGTVRAHGDSR